MKRVIVLSDAHGLLRPEVLKYLPQVDVVIYGHSHKYAREEQDGILWLKAALQSMSPKGLQALWKCNDTIARLNIERLEHMDLHRNPTPAILSYEGIRYRYMAPA